MPSNGSQLGAEPGSHVMQELRQHHCSESLVHAFLDAVVPEDKAVFLVDSYAYEGSPASALLKSRLGGGEHSKPHIVVSIAASQVYVQHLSSVISSYVYQVTRDDPAKLGLTPSTNVADLQQQLQETCECVCERERERVA